MNKVPFALALKSGVTAGIFAAFFNVILFKVVVFFSHLPFLVPMGPDKNVVEMTIPMIIFGCVLPALIASLLFWVLVKATRFGTLIFSIISYTVLLASIYPVLMLSAHTIEKIVLVMMHLIAAGLIIRKLKKAAREGVTTSEPAQTIQPLT